MSTSSEILTHFDPKLPLQLNCDGSSSEAGAELFHIFPNGDIRPIEFASKTLSKA